ncbi:uncharacterized protein EHS24_005412 [Apiotrichum porosum]|uniref:RNA export factor gle2 n=1 Tax=Apiotrichum porosum TaxID=105984 RepID=A0A427XCU9_9TREE|nr:uncharacterized protein EHS24_005412 [Apiotrichum porosum]RSH76665.1 hypothetical protein EHS24_005412 [Apiotrichum porosum]
MASGDTSLQPPADGIAALAWSADSSRLLVASWDSTIQLHTVTTPPSAPQIFSHPRPVLAVTFGSSPDIAYSGGLDKRIREWDFKTGECRVIGKHDDAISAMAWIPEHNILVTGSWDKSIKIWDPSAAEPLRSTSSLPERVYNLCYTPATGRILVSMAHRHVSVYAAYELSNASQEGRDAKADHTRESALKMLTRSVACMADGKGWASASIEGRIAVEYFDPDPAAQAMKYAFRAHRATVDGAEQVYPINALAYHPIHNTFASGGSDGVLSIWDHSAKKRMRLYPKYPTAISALSFSPDGTRLAIGVSYEHDNAVASPEDQARVLLLLKETVMDDCKPKARA